MFGWGRLQGSSEPASQRASEPRAMGGRTACSPAPQRAASSLVAPTQVLDEEAPLETVAQRRHRDRVLAELKEIVRNFVKQVPSPP